MPRISAALVMQYPLQSTIARASAHFQSILKVHNLEWVWQFVLENNTGCKNTYHNNEHMLQVTRLAWELFHVDLAFGPDKAFRKNSLEILLVACMLHDFNHSGGELKDEENIILAIETGAEAIAGSLDNQFGDGFADRVIDTLRVTQYPFVHQPEDALQRIIRDADALQSFEPNGVTLVMESLRMEMLGVLGRIPTHQEMLDGQSKFINGLVLFTEAGEAIRTSMKQPMLDACAAYVGLTQGKDPENAAS